MYGVLASCVHVFRVLLVQDAKSNTRCYITMGAAGVEQYTAVCVLCLRCFGLGEDNADATGNAPLLCSLFMATTPKLRGTARQSLYAAKIFI